MEGTHVLSLVYRSEQAVCHLEKAVVLQRGPWECSWWWCSPVSPQALHPSPQSWLLPWSPASKNNHDFKRGEEFQGPLTICPRIVLQVLVSH